MHILFVPAYYPSREAPITGIFFHDQASALHKAGHQVGVLTTPRINETLRLVQRDGLMALRATTRDSHFADFPVYRMHWGWFPRFFPPLLTRILTAAGYRAFEQYCEQHGKPDVLHGHNIFYGGYLAAQISKKYDVPMVLTEYSSSYLEGLIIFPGQSTIIRKTLMTASSCLVCGSSLIKPLQNYAPGTEIDVIGCIVDSEYFAPSDEPLPAKPFTFVVIAQLKERRKGFDVLLKSFHQAFAGQDDVRLLIRGNGPLRPELDKLIASLGLQKKVAFLPMMSRAELRDLIRHSHVLLSSSYVETFGVTVAEALACGKPVITTRSGGPEDFVTLRSGFIVDPGDTAAFARSMETMVAHHAEYSPEAVRADCVTRFSEPVYVARLETIYRDALSQKGTMS